MYKKKRNIWSVILFLTIIIIFFSIAYFIYDTDILVKEKKFELAIEILGMFITTLALLLTYNSLRNEQKQKHMIVRPYVILENIDFAVESYNKGQSKQLDFDFKIVNKGVGIANRIKVVIKKKKDKKIIFDSQYVRLDVANDNVSYFLADIRDEINKISNIMNKDSGSSISYGHYFGEALTDELYIKDYGDVKDYIKLIVEIFYYDIYGKKYKGTFDVVLDDKDYDLESVEEKLEEWN